MDGSVFNDAEIAFLRECAFDPNADYGCEMTSGAVHWADERFMDVIVLSKSLGRHYMKHLFAYRTSLLVGKPRESLRFAWDEAQARCPDWIGFRPERTTFAAHWPEFVEAALDSY